jgi:uncharacterized lipoprotein YajG
MKTTFLLLIVGATLILCGCANQTTANNATNTNNAAEVNPQSGVGGTGVGGGGNAARGHHN